MTRNPSALATLSASAINEWLACPRKFFFRRVERREPSYRSAALAFGSAFHEGVRWSLIQQELTGSVDRAGARDRFRSALRTELRADGPPVLFDDGENETKLAEIGGRMMDAFVGRFPMPDKLLGIELAFSAELFDPKTGECLPPLIGSVDALVERAGRPTVLEVKSGKRRFSNDRLEYDLQPSVYRVGTKQLGYDDVDIELVLTTKSARPDVQLERLARGPADERDLSAAAASVVRGVENSIDHPIRSWRCKQCEYAGVCL